MIGRRTVLHLIVLGIAWLLWPAPLRAAELPEETQKALRDSDQIYIATRRRNGALSSIKPVWFYYDGDKVFFTTSPTSWKAKRLAAGSPLYIWVGSENGPLLEGTAEPVEDPALIDRMGEAYAKKYWIAWLGFFKPRSDRVTSGKTIAYLVSVKQGKSP